MREDPDGMHQLGREDRLRLLRFVCSFVWADLRVQDEERAFVAELVQRLALDDREREQVESWLRVPPRPEEVDPAEIPREHRELFLAAARATIAADGRLAGAELDSVETLERLLR